jgi:hypothetical protein
MQSTRRQGSGAADWSGERLVTVGGYLMLLVLGVFEGLIGCFQYSRALGSFPVAAVAFALLIGVTCAAGAWGMHRPLGGLLPGAGWLVTSLVLAMGTQGGSVLITNTAAGQWFLFGGAACAAAGVVTGFVRWSPRRPAVADSRYRLSQLFPPTGRTGPAPGGVGSDERDYDASRTDPRKPDP